MALITNTLGEVQHIPIPFFESFNQNSSTFFVFVSTPKVVFMSLDMFPSFAHFQLHNGFDLFICFLVT